MNSIIEYLNSEMPVIAINIITLLSFVYTLLSIIIVIIRNVPKLFLFKRKKQYNDIIYKLRDNTLKYWSQPIPNDKYSKAVINGFKELSIFISDNDFKIIPSDYRSFLYNLLTMDMEDSHIFKCKKILL